MSCGIYKFTSKTTGLSYIGQSIDIERRYKEHKRANGDYSFHNAIKKYGWEDFIFEVLEYCEKDKLNEREKYWISYYNSYYNGYNETEGGEGSAASGKKRPVVQYDLYGNFIMIYNSILDAERTLGINSKASNISRVCQGKAYESNGYQWRYLNDNYINNIGKSPLKEKLKEGHTIAINKRTKLIARCDLRTHEILQIYKGFSEVEKDGYNRSTVCNVCNGKSKYSKGYFWKYIN